MDKRVDYFTRPQKICHLVSLERIFDSGIIETQVLNLLPEIKKKAKSDFKLYLMVVMPLIHLSKSGLTLNPLRYRREIKLLKRRLLNHNIPLILIPAIIFRFGIHLSVPSLVLFSLFTLPRVIAVLRSRKFDIIHCRSYISALLGMASKKILGKGKIIFDLRGLYPEEGIIQGNWTKDSLSYLLWKRIERWLLKNSDAIISVSHSFTDYLKGITTNNRIVPIFFGVDTKKFALGRRRKNKTKHLLGLSGKILFAYNGSLGSWHDPLLLAKIFIHISTVIPDSHLVVFTNYNKEKLIEIFGAQRIPPNRYGIIGLDPSEVPLYLPACDFGIVPSRESSTKNPEINVVLATMIGVKISEYLASGLPIIVNENVGGISSIMECTDIGVRFSIDDMANIAVKLLAIRKNYKIISNNALSVAKEFFDFDLCVNNYCRLYRDLKS